jgi:aspartyl-tRNA(Asn)/glutamyl-tRNA(Gln) amidotransferase subunit A
MDYQTVSEISQALRNKTISCVEITQFYLQRIQAYPHLNAYISINEENALKEAASADIRYKKGDATLLTGIPMAHKDVFCTKSLPTTCGSKMLANFVSPYQATLVKRLEDESVVMLGKTNMDEFAMGSTNESSYFGPVKNPWDITRVPGGSSGGSAAAVAANLAAFATGSDTGGSVRQPAAFSGITGLKPTYGLISRFGMVAYASSLDQAGIMAKTAEDIAMVLQTAASFDELDSTSSASSIPNYIDALKQPLSHLRIGVPKFFLHAEVETDIQNAVLDVIRWYETRGAKIVDIDLPLHPQWIPCYYVIACAEASSNLSRYDGIRFGHRSKHAQTLKELITHSRQEGFGSEVKQRILIGTHVLSAGHYDAYYLQAQKVRRLIQDELKKALTQVDVILGPTTPSTAFKIGEKPTSSTHRFLADAFTVGANLAGLPALSFPAGFSTQGLPIGVQLYGNLFDEAKLLRLAHAYQQDTPWHKVRPNLAEEL